MGENIGKGHLRISKFRYLWWSHMIISPNQPLNHLQHAFTPCLIPFFVQGLVPIRLQLLTILRKIFDLIGLFSSNNEFSSQFSVHRDAETLSFHKIPIQRSAYNLLPDKARKCDTLWENVKKLWKCQKRHLLRKFPIF